MESSGPFFGSSASADLIAALRTVEETGFGGQPRFRPSVQRQLQRVILTRAYGKVLLEFVYFVRAACEADPRRHRYENAIWAANPATSNAFRAVFSHHPFAGEKGVSIGAGADAFVVNYSRMPLLAAFAEFLVTILGYEEFDTLLSPVCGDAEGRSIAAETANAIGRAITGWLGPQLDSAHSQHQMKLVSGWLAANDNGGDDDKAILDAWRQWSIDPDTVPLGFLTYRSVYRCFLYYAAAASEWATQNSVDRASRIGPDRELGEVEPDGLSVLETLDEETALLAAFDQPPLNRVKFLTGRERDALELLAQTGTQISPLAVSFLRNAVWGDVQLRITEALRRRRPWDPESKQTYLDVAKSFAVLAEKVEEIALATLAILVEQRSEQALNLMMDLVPNLDLSPAAMHVSDDVIHLRPRNTASILLRELGANPGALGKEVEALLSRATKALRKTARKGFQADGLEEERIEAFEGASELFGGLSRCVLRGKRLHELNTDLEERFTADRTAFIEQFTRIYGVPA